MLFYFNGSFFCLNNLSLVFNFMSFNKCFFMLDILSDLFNWIFFVLINLNRCRLNYRSFLVELMSLNWGLNLHNLLFMLIRFNWCFLCFDFFDRDFLMNLMCFCWSSLILFLFSRSFMLIGLNMSLFYSKFLLILLRLYRSFFCLNLLGNILFLLVLYFSNNINFFDFFHKSFLVNLLNFHWCFCCFDLLNILFLFMHLLNSRSFLISLFFVFLCMSLNLNGVLFIISHNLFIGISFSRRYFRLSLFSHYRLISIDYSYSHKLAFTVLNKIVHPISGNIFLSNSHISIVVNISSL